MKPHLYHDGYSRHRGPTHPRDKWVGEHCKKRGLIPSSLFRRGKPSFVAIVRKRPASKPLLQKLQEVVRQHLEEEDDFGVKVRGDYYSWNESKAEDLMNEKTEKVVKFSVDFEFISYT